ncbi:cell division topological specificity factor MinE [Methylobacterium sp. WL120]|uniref:cell division topological specificity factor MinE n=1 Tax=Methylobacterium sp. WL120 TaxID=2603887 RepID=UPI0011C88B90|nr:cell division topological specificity factor MinE [Methylobacterium sp. WL120]TXM71003.1 cell division topological specificity factor MinE [Methylobacterium sp. WL120]
MTLLGLFNKRASGSVARERLQLILAHERSETGQPDLVITLREEILAVIAKHVSVERDKVKITLERGEGVSTLGLDIELPLTAAKGRNEVRTETRADATSEKAMPEKRKQAA